MGTKFLACFLWVSAIALGLPFLAATGQAQTITKSAGITAMGQHHAVTPGRRPRTPFERVIAPHMNQIMKQGNAGGATSFSQAASAGVNGSNVNFPGFVGVPFATIKDGDSSLAYNSVSGDFNNDGLMDVAAIKIDGTINVILNPGTFSNIKNLPLITSNNDGNPGSLFIYYVIVADMNGDKIPDLVGMDRRNNQVVVWIGKGDGTFGAPNSYPVTLAKGTNWVSSGGAILVGDFNGDGAEDVATLTYLPNYVTGGTTTVISELTLLNDGAGHLAGLPQIDSTFLDYYYAQFGEASVTTTDGTTPSGLAFLLNDSGVNNYNNGGTSVITMASNGDGTFTTAVEPISPLVIDYNLTIDASVISTNLTSNTGGPAPTRDIVFMTGDGAVYDAPFTSGNPTTVNLLVGVNQELFSFVPPVTAPPTPASLISTPLRNQFTMNVADMNGDGLQDLIVYTEAGISIFPNAGDGVFTAAPIQMAGATTGLQQPQPAPYDGSKYNSLLNVDASLGQIGYFQNLGAAASTQTGQFLAAPLTTGTDTSGNFELFGSNVEVVATADIDGDGVPDLIATDVSNSNNGSTDVVIGFRKGALAGNQSSNYTFKIAVKGQDLYQISNGLAYVEPMAISNVAGTGIVLVTYAGGPFIVTAGKDGVFGPPVALDMVRKPQCPVNYGDVGDVNGDGFPDIVLAYGGDTSCYGTNGIPSGFYTLLGKADGSFQPATFTPLGLALYQVKLINFSGTAGNLDIAALDQSFTAQVMSVFVVPNKADGSGSFNLAKASKPVSDYIVSDIVAGDYNSDGKQDLTLLTEGQYDITTSTIIPNSSGVLLLPGNGDYTFGTPALANPGQYPQWGSYADFNGDGNPDLALSEIYNIFTERNFTPMVQILPNLGGGVFGAPIEEFSSYLPSQFPNTVYTFVGAFTNSGGSDLLVASSYGTSEFVNRGVTKLALTASSITPGEGTSETFTATISQVVSAGIAASGSVAFSANGTALGSTPISNGIATFTTATLAVGSEVVTATYAGDADHNQSTASLNVTVAAVAPAFTLTPATASLSLAQGATGSVVVSVAGNSTFAGIVLLSCTGAPVEASCTASPTSVTLAKGQSAGVSIIVSTTAANNTYHAKDTRGISPLGGAFGGLSLVSLAFMLWPGRRRLPRLLSVLAIAALALGSAGALTGCSGGGNKYPGTNPGAYTLTVTAVSGTITQSQTIALTVTQAAK